MRIWRDQNDFETGAAGSCLAIGVFDGVHLGHQQVIRQTVTDAQQHGAKAVAVTFDRHPAAILAPEKAPALIYPLEKKLGMLDSLGLAATWLIEFNDVFSRQSADEFLALLATGLGPIKSICVGSAFRFGHERRGTVDFLKSMGKQWGFVVHGLAAVSLDGEKVSSTRIRQAVQSGKLDEAGQMLGRAYSLTGKVIEGDKLARKLGFPTANIFCENLVLPPNGVYAVQALWRGEKWPAVANIGLRPTISSISPVRVEVHFLNFNGDLYGETLDVNFVETLREEKRFPSVEALQVQVQEDIATARKILGLKVQ